MRVDLLTREYPPHVYGGAGVHVLELAKVLREKIADLRVHAFDGPRIDGEPGADPGVSGHADLVELANANPALKTLGVDLTIADATAGADLVHSHTWLPIHWEEYAQGLRQAVLPSLNSDEYAQKERERELFSPHR